MWNSLGVQQNSEQGESVLAGQMGRLHGGEAKLSRADSEWVVRVESGLPGGHAWFFSWNPESSCEGAA